MTGYIAIIWALGAGGLTVPAYTHFPDAVNYAACMSKAGPTIDNAEGAITVACIRAETLVSLPNQIPQPITVTISPSFNGGVGDSNRSSITTGE